MNKYSLKWNYVMYYDLLEHNNYERENYDNRVGQFDISSACL